MAKYCDNCGNPLSPEEKFCKQCGQAVLESDEAAAQPQKPEASANTAAPQKPAAAVSTYEFDARKATFKATSTPIHTTVTVQNGVLRASTECKSKILNRKSLNAQVRISDISSVKYSQFASIAVYDVFLFCILLIATLLKSDLFLAYALLSGVLLWRTLIPSLEITTNDRKKYNIPFSPRDSKKEMLTLVSQLTGKNVDPNAELKIPFSAKPFIAIVIFLVLGFVLSAFFA